VSAEFIAFCFSARHVSIRDLLTVPDWPAVW
jgi:hypothetical protein